VASIDISPPLTDFAFSDTGEAWVVHAGVLTEIDTTSNPLQGNDTALDAIPMEVVIGLDYVWVLGKSSSTVGVPDVVIRLDLDGRNPRVVQDAAGLDFAGGIDITSNESAIWVADQLGDRVIKIDPGSAFEDPRTIAQATLDYSPDGIVGAGDSVYAFNHDRGTVTFIDHALHTRESEDIRHAPVVIRPGLGFAWTLNEDGTITQVNADTLEFEDVPLPVKARAMTIDNKRGLIWVIAR
jgi:DNA-binding beta-propeller fold protein YncE